jgi:transcriptional/translational regulatory protein YebC/TACO1
VTGKGQLMDNIYLSDIVMDWAKDKNFFVPKHIVEAAIKEGIGARQKGKSAQFEALFTLYTYTGIKPDIELVNIFKELDE